MALDTGRARECWSMRLERNHAIGTHMLSEMLTRWQTPYSGTISCMGPGTGQSLPGGTNQHCLVGCAMGPEPQGGSGTEEDHALGGTFEELGGRRAVLRDWRVSARAVELPPLCLC